MLNYRSYNYRLTLTRNLYAAGWNFWIESYEFFIFENVQNASCPKWSESKCAQIKTHRIARIARCMLRAHQHDYSSTPIHHTFKCIKSFLCTIKKNKNVCNMANEEGKNRSNRRIGKKTPIRTEPQGHCRNKKRRKRKNISNQTLSLYFTVFYIHDIVS